MAPSSHAVRAQQRRAVPTVCNVHFAKTHFSKLLERVAGGEEIVIAKANRPVARLAPLAKARELGTARGQVWMADNFDAPLPEFERAFYGQ